MCTRIYTSPLRLRSIFAILSPTILDLIYRHTRFVSRAARTPYRPCARLSLSPSLEMSALRNHCARVDLHAAADSGAAAAEMLSAFFRCCC